MNAFHFETMQPLTSAMNHNRIIVEISVEYLAVITRSSFGIYQYINKNESHGGILNLVFCIQK